MNTQSSTLEAALVEGIIESMSIVSCGVIPANESPYHNAQTAASVTVTTNLTLLVD